MEITALIPHRPPMLMIDALKRCDADSAVATKTFRAGSYGLHDGRVIEAALIECVAQAVAALHGSSSGAQPHAGMLVGVTDFKYYSPAEADRELEVTVEITKRLGPLCMANGRVSQGEVPVAEGRLKFYIEEDAGAAS